MQSTELLPEDLQYREYPRSLLERVLDVYTAQSITEQAGISKDTILNLRKSDYPESEQFVTFAQYRELQGILPVYQGQDNKFNFVDLFAGIGGIRKAFDDRGGRCLFTAEWDKYAVKTYKANFPACPEHIFVEDIKSVTQPKGVPEDELASFIDEKVPDHNVLLAGFPCQPFSIAGVSKKNSLGRDHGFQCEDQGQLFFDVVRILRAKKPEFFLLENVKNLKGHDKGNTFKVIREELIKSGYWIANLHDERPDAKIIDGANFLPQHRERLILVGFREDIAKDTGAVENFDLHHVCDYFPESRPTMIDILDANREVDEKYTLSPTLWNYLQNYAQKHREAGNGFGYGKVHRDEESVARTLSARYYKDGSEILVDQSDMEKDPARMGRPRRLTPSECARLMGFNKVGSVEEFRMPVSDTQAYKQFGNSVVVPVMSALASMLEPYIAMVTEGQSKKQAA